jgi:hypothetical protein
MNSLLWKDWRENKGYLAMFSAWMALAACYAVAYELGHHYRAAVGSFSGLASFYSVFAAIILAMRVCRGEHTDRTIGFSASLPVSLRHMATVRILGAAATLAIPIVIGAMVMSIALASGWIAQALPRDPVVYVQMPQRGTASVFTSLEQLWSVAAIAVLGGAQLMLILSLLGCRLRTQAQVGLLGVVVALGSLIAEDLFWYGNRNPYTQMTYGALVPQSLVVHWGYGDESGGYTDHEMARYRWIAMGLAIPVLAILGSLFVAQYGELKSPSNAARRWRFRIALPPLLSRIPIRLPSRLFAMIWLELRQSLPLAGFGFLLALLVATAGALMEHRRRHSFDTSVLMEMPHTMFFVGMLWAAVVGSALYSADLGSALGGFWRSRPISPGLWYWTKFMIGLIAILIVLDGATILISWNAPREDFTSGMSWAYVACFPIIHSLMYSLAVLGTCSLRRHVIGGIAAILGYAVLTIGITAFPMTNPLEPINIYNSLLAAERAGKIDLTQHGYPLVFGIQLISVFALAAIAYRFAKPLQPTSRWFKSLAAS